MRYDTIRASGFFGPFAALVSLVSSSPWCPLGDAGEDGGCWGRRGAFYLFAGPVSFGHGGLLLLSSFFANKIDTIRARGFLPALRTSSPCCPLRGGSLSLSCELGGFGGSWWGELGGNL